MRNVHWLQALAMATSIVSLAPRSRSAAKSTAYDTDIVEPPETSGRLTFSADASDEQRSRAVKSAGSAMRVGDERHQHDEAGSQHGSNIESCADGKILHSTAPDELWARSNIGWGSRPIETILQRPGVQCFFTLPRGRRRRGSGSSV